MTAITYGYNVNGISTYRSSKVKSQRQTNVYELQECLNVLDEDYQLARKGKGTGMLDKVQWYMEV